MRVSPSLTDIMRVVAAVAVVLAGSARAASWRVTVHGQGTELGETPVVVPLQSQVPPGAYSLQSRAGGQAIPAHVFQDDGRTYLGAVFPSVSAKEPSVYALTAASEAAGVELRQQGENISVIVDGKPLTDYLPNSGPKPYYFPLIGPTGAPITRAYPMQNVAGEDYDHPHQRSFWFTHGKVNGIDFWSEQKGHGSIKETARKTVAAGPAVGVIRTTDEWLGPDGKKVCDDERVVRFYQTSASRVLDFEITLKATAGPVTFGDTKEGMFGVRVASSMDVNRKKGGKITNAEGLNDDAAWGKPSPWVDYTGPLDGRTVGIAILNHPDSFRFPTTWHVRTYGLFAANPFGWHDFGRKESGEYTVPAGESLHFGYRLILHKGDTAGADLPRAFQAYAKPPAVEVRSE